MYDRCILLKKVTSAGAYNRPLVTYEAQPEIVCGFNPSGASPQEILGTSEIPIQTPTLRVPVGTIVETNWRVAITNRLGTALVNPLSFEIIGPPESIGTAILLRLKSVIL